MCGLAGFAASDPRQPPSEDLRSGVAAMLSALAHRGPDGEGIRTFPGAVLGHRRLSIIDLSARASQPMPLICGEADRAAPPAWLAFNGEIYNYVELRGELEGRGHRFHSDSDTETILHLYEEEGVECAGKLRGMFAFALWDAGARRLLLARDRMGEKPLYYNAGPDGLAFASEIQALVRLARMRGEPVDISPSALRSYLALKYVPGPATALAAVFKLPAAHIMIYDAGRLEVRPYWRLPQASTECPADQGSLVQELRETVRESVTMRMRSDVPLGLFLSGGLDSGTVASAMAGPASRATGRIRTFTIGFNERDYSELRLAAKVARSLGTQHHEIVITPTPSSTIDLLPDLARFLDQPFADSSALALYHLAREVRRHVTVALSGDGSDELFLGYDRYRAHRIADRVARAFGRRIAGGRLASGLVRAVLPHAPGRRNVAGRARRFIGGVGLSPLDRNDAWITCIDPALAKEVLTRDFAGHDDPLEKIHGAYAEGGSTDPLLAIQHADLMVYLPDDLLHKLDAATMAHSLEARAPFLDHRVVELAMRIPPALKLRGGRGKAILREAFAPELPIEVLRGRKLGFGLPLDHWLRRDLSGYCRDLLLDRSTLSRGILARAGVESLLKEHQAGHANREDAIWSLLMLEHWLRAVIDAKPAARAPASLSGRIA